MPVEKVNHYLYPLNPKSGFGIPGINGETVSTSRDDFFKVLDYRRLSKWGVAHKAASLKRGDMIWVHFASPVSAICAVGRVQNEARWEQDWRRFAVQIRWDRKLTEKLKGAPIPLEAHGQVPYAAVRLANPKTLRVLTRWMNGHSTKSERERDTKVRFRTAEVEQRIGQLEFRAALMRAYRNRCAVTGCDIEEVLQAAHIQPVSKKGSHSLSNGILLRADIHNLFDRGLLTIDKHYVVQLDPVVRRSVMYKALHGKKLKAIPLQLIDRPSKFLLGQHQKFHLCMNL